MFLKIVFSLIVCGSIDFVTLILLKLSIVFVLLKGGVGTLYLSTFQIFYCRTFIHIILLKLPKPAYKAGITKKKIIKTACAVIISRG